MSKINELEDLVEQVDQKINQDSRSNSDEKKIKPGILISSIIVIILVAGIFLWITFRNNDNNFKQVSLDSAAMFNQGNIDGSISNLEEILKTNLSDQIRSEALISLASAYAQKGSLDFMEKEYAEKAIKVINESLEINPNNAEAYRVMAYSYEISEDYENAILNYEKSIELDSTNAITFAGLGHTYNLLGEDELAEINYKKALENDPILDYALYNLAKLQFKVGNMEGATESASLAVEVSPNNRFRAESLLLLGLIKAREKNYDEAIQLIEQSITTDPKLANSYVALAEEKLSSISPVSSGFEVFTREKDRIYAEADSLIDKAIEINPNLTYAHVVKSRILMLLDQHDKAGEVLRKSLDILPNDITLGVTEKEGMEKYIKRRLALYFNN